MTLRSLNTPTPEIVRSLLGDPKPHLTKGTKWRYGALGSLAVDAARGIWFDHESGEGGGILQLIIAQTTCRNQAEALQWLKSENHLRHIAKATESGATKHAGRAGNHQDGVKLKIGLDLWLSAKPITDTLAETYLVLHRSLPRHLIRSQAVLRFHDRVPANPYLRISTYHPAMLAVVQDPSGAFAGVHITYLDTDGKKATIDPQKRLLGPNLSGCSVRFAETQTSHILVGEGIENTLAAMFLSGLPGAATLSSSLMRAFKPWKTIKEITPAPDHDRPSSRGAKAGQDAADALRQRLSGSHEIHPCLLPHWPGSDHAETLRRCLIHPDDEV